jgi:hypothetical protein
MNLKDFTHPLLGELENYAFRRSGTTPDYAFQIVLGVFVLSRIAMDVRDKQPIYFLVMEAGALLVIFHFIIRRISRRATIHKAIDGLYRDRLKQPDRQIDQVVSEFAVQGPAAIRNLPDGVLLAGMFDAYSPTGYRDGRFTIDAVYWDT